MFGTVLIGGLWAASAVYVAGWTWRAFTATYTTFPDQGQQSAAGGLNTRAEGQKLGEGLLGKIPIVGTALSTAAQYLGSITGTEANLNPQQIARLQKLAPPPARIVKQLESTYAQSGGTMATRATPQANKAFQEFFNWGKSNSWQAGDMEAYLTLLFPHTTWNLR